MCRVRESGCTGPCDMGLTIRLGACGGGSWLALTARLRFLRSSLHIITFRLEMHIIWYHVKI